MLSHEERIAEVKRRTAEKERQKRLRRRWIAAVSGVAACLAVIVGVSLSMPGIVERIEPGTFSGFETAATMLGGSAALGYIVIGLLAFVLGVCVTILCFRIRLLNRSKRRMVRMELVSNLSQFIVTLLGFCLSGIWYLKSRAQAYFLLTCFYGCFALGSLYWTLYLLLFSETPQVFYVSEFGWVASVIFLYLLQYGLSTAEERGFACRKALLAPLFGVPLCMFYCTFGDVLSNLLWCGMMIVISHHSIRGLAYAYTQTGTARELRHFHIGVLCYTAVEYALWTSGCFWSGASISSPYCWFDFLLTLCLLALLPATEKAVVK